MKKYIAGAIIAISSTNVFSKCLEVEIWGAIAWDNEYEYRKRCVYNGKTTRIDDNGHIIVADGEGEAHTQWYEDNINALCPATKTVEAIQINTTTLGAVFPRTVDIPGTLQFSDTERKISGRVATDWGYRPVWRDSRTGDECIPE